MELFADNYLRSTHPVTPLLAFFERFQKRNKWLAIIAASILCHGAVLLVSRRFILYGDRIVSDR
jgi:hypothetical protein